jgi:hypothetical protein
LRFSGKLREQISNIRVGTLSDCADMLNRSVHIHQDAAVNVQWLIAKWQWFIILQVAAAERKLQAEVLQDSSARQETSQVCDRLARLHLAGSRRARTVTRETIQPHGGCRRTN